MFSTRVPWRVLQFKMLINVKIPRVLPVFYRLTPCEDIQFDWLIQIYVIITVCSSAIWHRSNVAWTINTVISVKSIDICDYKISKLNFSGDDFITRPKKRKNDKAAFISTENITNCLISWAIILTSVYGFAIYCWNRCWMQLADGLLLINRNSISDKYTVRKTNWIGWLLFVDHTQGKL